MWVKLLRQFGRSQMLWLAWLCLVATTVAAQPKAPEGIPERPTTMVSDLAGVLSSSERGALEQRLRRFRDSTSNEIAVLIAPRLPEGEELADYSNSIARAWGVGSKGNNNGVLIAVFVAERKARIEVGYGLEPVLTDGITGRIIRDQLRPAFRAGRYAEGLQEAVGVIERVTRGEYKAAHSDKKANNRAIAFGIAGVIVLVFVIIYLNDRRNYGRGRPKEGYRESDGSYFFWGGYYGGHHGQTGGGDGGWGGGGSDFGGFGGGDFGGGGASGDW